MRPPGGGFTHWSKTLFCTSYPFLFVNLFLRRIKPLLQADEFVSLHLFDDIDEVSRAAGVRQIAVVLRFGYLFILLGWGTFPLEKEARILREIRLNGIYGVFEIGGI